MENDQIMEQVADLVSGSTIDYTVILTAISGKIDTLSGKIDTLNGLVVGIILFLGFIAGILFMLIFWNQLKD